MPDKLSGQDPADLEIQPDNELESAGFGYDGAADSGEPLEEKPTARFKIREAIRSVYGPRQPVIPPPPPEPVTHPPEPVYTPDPDDVQRLIYSQVDNMVEEARELAHAGQKDTALKILSRAVRIGPDHSMAWTWLGGLLIDRNPERALYCLERAYALDPDNIRAEKGLAYIKEILYPPTPEPVVEDENAPVPPELSLVKVEDESREIEPVDPSSVKIGLSEVYGKWREKYPQIGIKDIPTGGAQVSVPRRKRRNPSRIPAQLKLSLWLFGGLLIFSIIGVYFLVAKPSFEPPPPTPTAIPVIPTPTPSVEEQYAVRIRAQVERYGSFFERARALQTRFDAGEIRWEALQKGYKELQIEIKEQKKRVDELAGPSVTPLLVIYKGLQEISILSVTSINFMVSGTENISDEDLNEGLRQFSRLSGMLSNISRQLDAVAPIPDITTDIITPGLTPVSPTITPVSPSFTPAPATNPTSTTVSS
jgi:tetratricopeptide (TPR) repeat protein